jgi:NAD+ kinase
MQVRRIGILYHPLIEATCAKSQELTYFLSSRGVDVWTCSSWEIEKAISSLDSTDLILTTGGDGTLLRAAQIALRHQIPITGINMGNLGFLTEVRADEVLDKLPDLLNGKGWLDERMMLEANLITAEPTGNPPHVFYALNDVVLARGAIVKLTQLKISIDDKPLTNLRADGLILATATGSTSYSMAAGGPVIYPQSNDLLLVPVASHLSWNHSLVLSSSSIVEIQLVNTDQATLSVDGHVNIPVFKGATVVVKRSAFKTRFLRLQPQNNFFQLLEEKLRNKN